MHINRPILRIPTIAIHLKRDTNEKLEINKQDHLYEDELFSFDLQTSFIFFFCRQAVLALKTEEELNKTNESKKNISDEVKHFFDENMPIFGRRKSISVEKTS